MKKAWVLIFAIITLVSIIIAPTLISDMESFDASGSPSFTQLFTGLTIMVGGIIVAVAVGILAKVTTVFSPSLDSVESAENITISRYMAAEKAPESYQDCKYCGKPYLLSESDGNCSKCGASLSQDKGDVKDV